jgi:hypothetical protein
MGSLDEATVYTEIPEVGTAARPKTALFILSDLLTRVSQWPGLPGGPQHWRS